MIFANQLKKIDYANTPEALKTMASHIRYIQEQLEFTLMNLDSKNISEIDTTVTNITSGSVAITGNNIKLSGKNGELFEVGTFPDGTFRFTVNGPDGTQMIYLRDGNMILTKNASINIDGGEW